MSYKGRNNNISRYYLRYSGSNLGVTTSTSGSSGRIKNPFTQVIAAAGQTLPASTYTATVYGTDANTPVEVYEISPENDEVSIPLNNLNNDAVKFKIDGLTGNEVGIFRVSIDVLMLDPFVQTIETAHVEDGNTISAVSSSSMNLKFNNGETIVVPIPGTSGGDADQLYQLAFRNAFNENRSVNVSETPSGNGLSNCYLIDSPYELNGTGSYIEADKAGTTVLDFTNIKDVKAGKASRLQDNEFNKTEAGYEEIWLKNGETKTVYIYAADVPTYLVILESRRKVEHIAYCYYQAKVMPYIVEEVPDLEVADVNDIVVFRSTLKGANNKNGAIAKDGSPDKQHYFFGIKVKAKKKNQSSTEEVKGILTSEQIINAVKDLLIINFKDHLYADDDPFRTILYLDMSELTAVSDADGLWDDFRSKTADNCLYFMPPSFSQQAQNVVAGGADGKGEAVGDIVIYDQQPFFTPYSFKTGTHTVTYERTGTNGKEATQNTTIMLPFDIPLSADGHLKTYSNQVDKNMRFYHMTELGEEDDEVNTNTKVYQFTAEPVTTGVASANTPYHIVSHQLSGNSSYKIQLTGATFMPSPKTGVASVSNGTLTGYGSYNGVAVDMSDDILYFSKDYFWSSSTLAPGSTVKILPYRAYYKTNTPTTAKQIAVFFKDLGEEEPGLSTGITDSKVSGFRLVPQHGSILVTTNADTSLKIYDLAGRRILDEHLAVGATRQYAISAGIYIVNGKKIYVE